MERGRRDEPVATLTTPAAPGVRPWERRERTRTGVKTTKSNFWSNWLEKCNFQITQIWDPGASRDPLTKPQADRRTFFKKLTRGLLLGTGGRGYWGRKTQAFYREGGPEKSRW